MMPARSLIMREGAQSEVFTLRDGWAYRFHMLPDGRRQILSFLLPGEIVGLQALRMGRVDYAVRALTDVVLCSFDTEALAAYIRARPAMVATSSTP